MLVVEQDFFDLYIVSVYLWIGLVLQCLWLSWTSLIFVFIVLGTYVQIEFFLQCLLSNRTFGSVCCFEAYGQIGIYVDLFETMFISGRTCL